jgi:hypothetical protein
MSIQYQGAGYSSFEEFMNDTGVDKDNFADAKKSANEFGTKFQETFNKEFKNQYTEAQERAKRLDSQPKVLNPIPNSLLYFGLMTAGIYLAYSFIFKSE